MTQPEHESDAEAVFGAMVRDRRSTLALTQEQLRRRLVEGFGIDLSKTAMSRLEQGERPIRLNEVTALAQLLGIDLRHFGDQEGPTLASDRRADEEAIRRELAAVDHEVGIATNAYEAARVASSQAAHRLAVLKRQREALLEVLARVKRGDEEILDMIRIAKEARKEAERDGQH